MSSVRETALLALYTALQTVPSATVERNTVIPQNVPAAGLIILRDGRRIEAEPVTISPRTWHWQHEAVVEVIVQGADDAGRSAQLDALLLAMETAVSADRHLGGAVDWVEVLDLLTDDMAVPAAPALKGAAVTVAMLYNTTNLLG